VDKKSKKRLEVLNKKLQTVMLQLAGAKQQTDEPGEVERVEAEIQKIRSEITELKNQK
jgi:hypothetical protein